MSCLLKINLAYMVGYLIPHHLVGEKKSKWMNICSHKILLFAMDLAFSIK